jgi:dihydroorotate dehydrogenase
VCDKILLRKIETMTNEEAFSLLPSIPDVPHTVLRQVQADYQRFASAGAPPSIEEYLVDRYRLDVHGEYGGCELANPWGKASGQLSMTARQVTDDVAAGLGFVVLKTVIAQDELGEQSMKAWAIPESRMLAEPIVGKSGDPGWTVSWKGRGWWQSFDKYLELVHESVSIAAESRTLIVPSCKYHLPTPDEHHWKESEYNYTTRRIYETWTQAAGNTFPIMPLEKDFSPTLAGSDRAAAKVKILEWLRVVPRLIRQSITTSSESNCQIRVGIKVFNAVDEDAFQIEMLQALHAAGADRADFLVYANRLFDPLRSFDGHPGIAYGGPDLSDRNLLTMSEFLQAAEAGSVRLPLLPWSATGNIVTGKLALEYALLGATSFQMHTLFQLPTNQFTMTVGSKIDKALHELYFHPESGFVVWMHHIATRLGLPQTPIRFLDIVGKCRELKSAG